MPSIHHATAKRAEAEGIEITVLDDGRISADGLIHKGAKTALDAAILSRTLRAEYPSLSLASVLDGSGAEFALFHGGEDIQRWEWLPDLADVLDAAIEAGIDPEEGAEDDTASAVVVAPLYKQRYAEGGHPEHCGDWLAYQLEGAFLLPAEGKKAAGFDTEAFTACLTDNGIPLVGKWAALPESGQPGWQGRYRMNGRQKLERQVAACGELVLHGETLPVPEDALEVLRIKHPKAAPEAEAKVAEAHSPEAQEG